MDRERTSRRTFLEVAAATASCVFLGRELLRGEHVEEESGVWDRALARMRDRGQWGLALRVPNDPRARAELGRALESAADAFELRAKGKSGWDFPASARFAVRMHEVVFFCARTNELEWPEGDDVALLDCAGRTVRTARIDWAAEPKLLLATLDELLDGDGRAARRRKEHLAVTRLDVSALETAFRTEDPSALQSAALEHWPKAGPWLAHWIDAGAPPAVARTLEAVAFENLRDADLAEPEAVLFEGVQWRNGIPYDPCPGCGLMGGLSIDRRFVSFFATERESAR